MIPGFAEVGGDALTNKPGSRIEGGGALERLGRAEAPGNHGSNRARGRKKKKQ